MLPGFGSSELFVIALVALIVVGPKDLPVMLRKLGQWVARMRSMANEFRASFDEMARQSELDELRKEVEALRSGSYLNPVSDATDAMRDAHADIEASLRGGSVQFPPSSYVAPADEAAQTIAAPDKAKRKRAPKAAEIVGEPAPARRRSPRKKAETPS